MPQQTTEAAVDPVEPEFVDFDQFVSYEDDEDLVVTDRQDPRAWIRSDATEPIRR